MNLHARYRLAAPDRRHGFTLIELLVVVSIIAVLVAILIPALGGARTSARIQSTRSTMNAVQTAIAQFGNDNNGELPGVFSQEQLGSDANDTGFTVMENALVDLAGGLDSDCSNPSGETICVDITIGTQTRMLNTSLVGANTPGNPGYLELPGRILEASDPNDQFAGGANPGDGSPLEFPDILDAFGNPITLWLENPSASRTDPFAAETSTADRALFYQRANSGYLDSNSQAGESTLNENAGELVNSMRGLLGHPGFPVEAGDVPGGPPPAGQSFVPSRPRARVIVHSAGPDGTFAENGGDDAVFIAYRPSGSTAPLPPNGIAAPSDASGSILGLDDILVAAN